MLSLAEPQSPFLFCSPSSGSVWGWPVVSSPPTGFISIRPPRTCGLSLPLIFPTSQSSGLVDFQALWGWANRVWWVCALGPMVLLKRGMLVTAEVAVPFTVMSDRILNHAPGCTQFQVSSWTQKTSSHWQVFFPAHFSWDAPFSTQPADTSSLSCIWVVKELERISASPYPGPLGLEKEASVLSSAQRLNNATTAGFLSSGEEGREAVFWPFLLTESWLLNLRGLPGQPAAFALYRHNVDKGSAG